MHGCRVGLLIVVVAMAGCQVSQPFGLFPSRGDGPVPPALSPVNPNTAADENPIALTAFQEKQDLNPADSRTVGEMDEQAPDQPQDFIIRPLESLGNRDGQTQSVIGNQNPAASLISCQ